MNEPNVHKETAYPEKEGTVYRGTVNSGYYKDPDKGIDDALSEDQIRTEKDRMMVALAKIAEFTTNAIRAIGI